MYYGLFLLISALPPFPWSVGDPVNHEKIVLDVFAYSCSAALPVTPVSWDPRESKHLIGELGPALVTLFGPKEVSQSELNAKGAK